MTTRPPEDDLFVEALRADLPSARDEARVKARLLSAGVIASVVMSSTNVAAGGAGVGGAAGAQATLAKIGVFAKLGSLPVAAKAGVAVAVTAAAVGTAVPVVQHQREVARQEQHTRAAQQLPRPPVPQLESVRRPAPSEAALAPRPELSTPPVAAPVAEAATALPSQRVERASNTARAVVPPRAEAPVITKPAQTESPVSRVVEQPGATATFKEAAPEAVLPGPPAAAAPDETALSGRATESNLAEETRLIERALSALSDGRLELSRHWLDEHARRFPDGLLAIERRRGLERLRHAERPRDLPAP